MIVWLIYIYKRLSYSTIDANLTKLFRNVGAVTGRLGKLDKTAESRMVLPARNNKL
jgi:hypothetical protein